MGIKAWYERRMDFTTPAGVEVTVRTTIGYAQHIPLDNKRRSIVENGRGRITLSTSDAGEWFGVRIILFQWLTWFVLQIAIAILVNVFACPFNHSMKPDVRTAIVRGRS